MVFDTKTGEGTLTGNVEMVIFDMGASMIPLPGSATPSEDPN